MKNPLFVMALLCVIHMACNTNTEQANSGNTSSATTDIAITEKGILPIPNGTDTAEFTNAMIVYNGTNPSYDWDKKIIKTADIQTRCKDYKMYNQQVHALARQYGGWIAAELEVQHSDRINNSITIRVPVPQFEDLATAIANLDANTLEKRISTEDVTGKIVDVRGRMAVKKELRDKYLEMMKRTTKIEDALKVQDELNNMHESIEMAATQVNYLQHQASYSTINLAFFQPLEIPVIDMVDNRAGFGSRMLSAASNGAVWMLDLLVGLVSIWPILLGLLFVLIFLRRKKNLLSAKTVPPVQ